MPSIGPVCVEVAKIMRYVIVAVRLVVMLAFARLTLMIAIVIVTAIRMSIVMVPTAQAAVMTKLLFQSMDLALQKVFERIGVGGGCITCL